MGNIADFSRHVEKPTKEPNPPTPFPKREGGEFKASQKAGERNGSEVFQI
jgi:hypothetical protein